MAAMVVGLKRIDCVQGGSSCQTAISWQSAPRPAAWPLSLLVSLLPADFAASVLITIHLPKTPSEERRLEGPTTNESANATAALISQLSVQVEHRHGLAAEMQVVRREAGVGGQRRQAR
jgi:hypothetical protein